MRGGFLGRLTLVSFWIERPDRTATGNGRVDSVNFQNMRIFFKDGAFEGSEYVSLWLHDFL